MFEHIEAISHHLDNRRHRRICIDARPHVHGHSERPHGDLFHHSKRPIESETEATIEPVLPDSTH